ncbi:unnamed protein product [Rotaria sp. Silwood2]|nr:unnamed protein product [Rotaria sp. Silwood2]CAF2624907.1 unnamed protein product [Rotaria sp. Silwood2]CAF2844675.1 unnamed protein product [Rotaria sp. Silwood2]CAF3016656.1 unnamed protein product [Rotaria sp. Silwood2]
MMKMYLFIMFILIVLNNFINGDENKYQQAQIRARLAQAKSIQEVLIILKSSSNKGRLCMYYRCFIQIFSFGGAI